jgi:hypothetical protein
MLKLCCDVTSTYLLYVMETFSGKYPHPLSFPCTYGTDFWIPIYTASITLTSETFLIHAKTF